jgi:hypothetical protein
MVLLSAQSMDAAAIARVAFTSEDRVRDVMPTSMPTGSARSASNVEIARTPSNASWLNRIEAQLTALRYLALDGTDHAYDERLHQVVARANVG